MEEISILVVQLIILMGVLKNSNEDSWKKGKAFEDFIEDNVFDDDSFRCISRPPEKRKRFVDDALKPDFKFEVRESGQQFYVEAKYRSRYFNAGGVDLLSSKQMIRYKEIEQEEKLPIYIALGLEGQASNPELLSVIPFSAIKMEYTEADIIDDFIITHHWQLEPSRLRLHEQLSRLNSEQPNSTEKEAIPLPSSEGKRPKKTWLMALPIAVGIFCGFLFASFWNSGLDEDDIPVYMDEYYQVWEDGRLSDLEEYLSPNLDRWFDSFNVSRETVIENAEAYRTKFPDAKINVDWKTLKVQAVNDDKFRLEYELDYDLVSRKGTKMHFDLAVFATLNKDGKLVSMYEEKLNQ